jgi:DNA-binding MarR family transcriptional regulator
MSFSQFLVLMALVDQGESKQALLADYAGVTPAVITKQVEHLAGLGLVSLGPSHTDRRANVVKLTVKGRQTAAAALETVQQAFASDAKFPDHYRSKLDHWLKIQST